MRIHALDGLRWLASIQVVLFHHFKHSGGNLFCLWGQLWTQFFFVMSGYVLGISAMSKPQDSQPLWAYMLRRLRQLYPAYLLALLVELGIQPIPSRLEWQYFPFHVFLLQSWIPKLIELDDGGYKVVPGLFVPQAWFISVLVPYWCVLRPLARALRARSIAFSGFVIVCCWSFSLVLEWLSTSILPEIWGCNDHQVLHSDICREKVHTFLRLTPWGYFHVFLAGICASRIHFPDDEAISDAQGALSPRATTPVAPRHVLLRNGCVVGYLAYFVLFSVYKDRAFPRHDFHNMFLHNGGILPILLLILLGAASGEDPFANSVLTSAPMSFLGRLSYIQYLMDGVVTHWIKVVIGWTPFGQAIYVPALVLFAALCQRMWLDNAAADSVPPDHRCLKGELATGEHGDVEINVRAPVSYGTA